MSLIVTFIVNSGLSSLRKVFIPFLSLLYIFFFSSRRRHTRLQGDWSSDVCSSDLGSRRPASATGRPGRPTPACRRSEERRVGKSVDLGGRRIIKKKKKNKQDTI